MFIFDLLKAVNELFNSFDRLRLWRVKTAVRAPIICCHPMLPAKFAVGLSRPQPPLLGGWDVLFLLSCADAEKEASVVANHILFRTVEDACPYGCSENKVIAVAVVWWS